MQISLRAARVNKGVKVRETAEKLGVHPATLYRWEAGQSAPTVVQMRKLCQFYEVDIDSIYFEEKSTKSKLLVDSQKADYEKQKVLPVQTGRCPPLWKGTQIV